MIGPREMFPSRFQCEIKLGREEWICDLKNGIPDDVLGAY